MIKSDNETIRNRPQISLTVLRKFKRINDFYSPRNYQKAKVF